MPKCKDINKILIIGSGQNIIGQSGEYDCFTFQACKALHSLGYHNVLVNSNPSAFCVEPGIADTTYIEPLNFDSIIKIIEKEQPGAILPGVGGQVALKLIASLESCGALEKYGIKVLAFSPETIFRCENYGAFKEVMDELHLEVPRGKLIYSIEEAEIAAIDIGYPVMVRPSYTIGGAGSGICYNVEELRIVAGRSLAFSLNEQALVAESLEGWGKLELVCLRDSSKRIITAGLIEYIDALGVNTGDSIAVTPMLTVDAELQKILQMMAYNIIEKLDITGSAAIQFAYNEQNRKLNIISVYPGLSSSAAIISAATGLSLSFISTELATGLLLKDIPYNHNHMLDGFTPIDDHVAVKVPKFNFEKFRDSKNRLGTQMHATGEAMGIGMTFKEALQKATRCVNSDLDRGLGWKYNKESLEELNERFRFPTSDRLSVVCEALRKGANVQEISNKTYIKPWFIEQLIELVDLEKRVITFKGKPLPKEILLQAKKEGFADKYLSGLLGIEEQTIKEQLSKIGEHKNWVEIIGTEGKGGVCFSTYNGRVNNITSKRSKVLILGAGTSSIENNSNYDYGVIKTEIAVRDAGYETILINCNPATVAIYREIVDKVYFEPLTAEDIISIYELEKPVGVMIPSGSANVKLVRELQKAGLNILGTPLNTLNIVSDRSLLLSYLKGNKIPVPEIDTAINHEDAIIIAKRIGYPLIVSTKTREVKKAEVVHNEDELLANINLSTVSVDEEIILEQYFEHSKGIEVNAISDGEGVFIPAIIEHIENAGINPGDVACVIPPLHLSLQQINVIKEYTQRVTRLFNIKGAVNIQFGVDKDQIYVLDVKIGNSLTTPLVSRVCNIPVAEISALVMLGQKLEDIRPDKCNPEYFGVKEAVFPFNIFSEVDPMLGLDMKSTGEVLGLADSFGLAYWKAQESVTPLPTSGTILITINEQDRPGVEQVARQFVELGFKIKATFGTRAYLVSKGILAEPILKEHEGRPNITDAIKNKEIQLIINTPAGRISKYDDSYIRKAAIKYGVPYITTLTGAKAAARGILAFRNEGSQVKSLQEYYKSNKQKKLPNKN